MSRNNSININTYTFSAILWHCSITGAVFQTAITNLFIKTIWITVFP